MHKTLATALLAAVFLAGATAHGAELRGHGGPAQILEGHTGPVADLELSPDGSMLASASWDTTVRLWPLAGGPARVLEGHRANVNALAFLADATLVSAGYDATVIFWPSQA
ncbi:MAG: hypothetical protein E5Y60_16490, partial [Mesorhizobium sp.]